MKKQMTKCVPTKDEFLLQKHQNVVPDNHLGHSRGSYGHCYLNEHGRHRDSHDHHNYQHHTVNHIDQQNTFPKMSMSSLSSSSSSSWNSETSLENDKYFVQKKPQYSASCSNLPEASNKLRCEVNDTARFLSQRKQSQSKIEKNSQTSRQSLEKSELRRRKSMSLEGLLQSADKEPSPEVQRRVPRMDFSPVHKTTSLGQHLLLDEKPATASRLLGPKRAVSSIHLPSKGILKNKEEEHRQEIFRKAKSMEVLSTEGQVIQKQSSVETLKESLVKEKLDFSAFLDEITRQVISPSRLSSYRLPNIIGPESLKSHHEECRKILKTKQKEDFFLKSSKHQPIRLNKPERGKVDKDSHNPETSSSLGAAYHHLHQESPEKQHTTPKIDVTQKQQHEKYIWPRSKGTTTNPESAQQGKQYNNRNNSGSYEDLHSGFSIPTKYLSKESDTLPSNTVDPKVYNINKHMGYQRHSKNLHRDSISSMERAEFLEHYNRELHENLLQTVACIEITETALESTKAELNKYKDKYKRLQESYCNLQQAHSVLQQELKSVMDNTTSEQTYLHIISELTKELDAAKNTITSLGNSDIPSLVKKILEKHFNTQDSEKNFFLSSSPSQCDIVQQDKPLGRRNNQLSTAITEDNVSIYSFPQRDSLKNQEHEVTYLPWMERDILNEPENTTARGKANAGASTRQPPDKQNPNLYFSAVDPSPVIFNQTVDATVRPHNSLVKTDESVVGTELPSVKKMFSENSSLFPDKIKPTIEEKGQGCLGQQDLNDVTCRIAQSLVDLMNQTPDSVKYDQ